uniref:Cytochrome c oxidase subunit 2 n=1 Tax=Schistosoma japonicum TaxID=6182 RepID=A0A0U3J801_SCHJA|nr:cytochrome c oxidase subunit II [Schistosoma japonicum]ALV85200.1 cytochrome c oxidase subunit II [Schistosoma japonicum]ALV85212.1 cytochrome c oxidase subunit II [Schistosoma japonicum]ALV85224.1 cytochrome c oxidase subunit II [Schistosoma japonicum]ALV85236.1 cytochrome c oxidase subunit II [Schistosoma japonicum]
MRLNHELLIYYDLVNYVLFLCCFIPLWCMIVMCYQIYSSSNMSIMLPNESPFLEFIWTLIPTLMVMILCFFNLNYLIYNSVQVMNEPIKIVGHQWYWTYELLDGSVYDSFMTDFVNGVNKPLRLERNISYILLITSDDVIHSFSVPDLGLKMDAIPGRINSVIGSFDRFGVFIGYCTELCGAGHSYMPIVVEVVEGNRLGWY